MESKVLTTQKVIVAFIVALLALAPFATFAQTQERENPQQSMRGDAMFCENLDEIAEQLQEKMEERAEQARENFEARLAEYAAIKAERMQQLADDRATADAEWAELIGNLLDQAQTPEQEEAINEFEATVADLLATRRGAVDEAIEVFEAEAALVRDERGEVFSSLIEELLANIRAAFEEAYTSCEAGTDPSEVRAELKSDLDSARETFQGSFQNYGFREQIQELNQERKATVQEAVEVYKAALEVAKETLRDTIGG